MTSSGAASSPHSSLQVPLASQSSILLHHRTAAPEGIKTHTVQNALNPLSQSTSDQGSVASLASALPSVAAKLTTACHPSICSRYAAMKIAAPVLNKLQLHVASTPRSFPPLPSRLRLRLVGGNLQCQIQSMTGLCLAAFFALFRVLFLVLFHLASVSRRDAAQSTSNPSHGGTVGRNSTVDTRLVRPSWHPSTGANSQPGASGPEWPKSQN